MKHLADPFLTAPVAAHPLIGNARTAWSERRYARLVRPDGRCRVLPLLAIDDPRLDVPTYLRRGLRIPGVNCESA